VFVQLETDLRKFLLAAAVASITFAGAASAADLAPRYTKAPSAPVALYNWTGFYIGIHGGGDWSRGDGLVDALPSAVAFNRAGDVFGLDASAAVAGVHGGYNWQVAPNWLIGAEADWSWTNNRATASAPVRDPAGLPFAGTNITTMTRSIDGLATIRGRLGWVNNNLLLYVTGGGAWGDVNYFGTTPQVPPGTVWSTNFRKDEFGFVVGAGGEYGITPHLVLRAEYLFYRLSGESVTTNGVPPIPPFQIRYTWNDVDVHVARVGLSYKFGGPVVARY
jgi:outer membrane immunogenic protein